MIFHKFAAELFPMMIMIGIFMHILPFYSMKMAEVGL